MLCLLKVTILILIDGFLQYDLGDNCGYAVKMVTILILIDGFLQLSIKELNLIHQLSHNPYFNRWFSAMMTHL